jgi:cyclin-dependent kinase 7
MLLNGVGFCHDNWVLHRDIKPGNMLVGQDGQLVLADFGLAKVFGSPDRDLSHQACTLWYRAPELLFGAQSYGTAADMWSVGCIFAELLSRKPFFPGENQLNQLSLIFAALGTPVEAQWPGLTSLPQYTQFSECQGTPLREMFGAASDDALELLSGLLTFNPQQRFTAQQAANHRYFTSNPPPTDASQLPTSADVQRAAAAKARQSR